MSSPGERRAFMWMMLVTLLLGGCAHVDLRVTTGVPKGSKPVRRIAVVSFGSVATVPQAGPTLTAAVVNALRRRMDVQVVEAPGASQAQAERWGATKLGESLGVDAVLVGEVISFEYGPNAQPGASVVSPSLGISLRLISSSNGDVLWGATVDAADPQLGSYAGVSLFDLAQDVADEVADALGEVVAG